MSDNNMLGRATKRNGPYPAPSELLGNGGNKVIVPTRQARAVEKIPEYRPFKMTQARQASIVRAGQRAHMSHRAVVNALGTLFLTDAEIGNVNPTLDWRLAFNDGNSAADAPYGYSAFWDS